MGEAPFSTGDGQESDVFVSYAYGDDDADAAGIGWVGKLVDRIEARLRQLLGVTPHVYVDKEKLKLGQRVSETLFRTISASRTLLIILSPSYCRSGWCRVELERFLDRGEATRGSIFVAEAECMPRDEWPTALRDLKSIALWQNEGGIPNPEEPPAVVRGRQVESLRGCDGAILVYGEVTRSSTFPRKARANAGRASARPSRAPQQPPAHPRRGGLKPALRLQQRVCGWRDTDNEHRNVLQLTRFSR